MPQALKLTEKTIMLCSIKTDVPTKDLQAMYDYYRSTGRSAYIVFDYHTLEGDYLRWLAMSEDFFDTKLKFVFGENPRKFTDVVSI